jgi:hypothetical protein
VALWATQKLLPLVPDGEFSAGLAKARAAALALYEKIQSEKKFKTIFPPELDIVVWAPNGRRASQISERSEKVFRAAAEKNLHLATLKYPSELLRSRWADVTFDREDVTCLRSCLMKPEHCDWIEEIWKIILAAAGIV